MPGQQPAMQCPPCLCTMCVVLHVTYPAYLHIHARARVRALACTDTHSRAPITAHTRRTAERPASCVPSVAHSRFRLRLLSLWCLCPCLCCSACLPALHVCVSVLPSLCLCARLSRKSTRRWPRDNPVWFRCFSLQTGRINPTGCPEQIWR